MRSPTPSRRSSGFTIVELLVVIAVIVSLMGLLLAGLQAAQKASQRTRAASDIRQLGQAWMQYASTYGDACMPGYLDEGVQSAWKVRYRDKSGERIPPAFAATYPYRLLPYLDHAYDLLYGYLEANDDFAYTAQTAEGAVNADGMRVASDNPAFGYNAFYLGGWWRMQGDAPSMRFANSRWQDSGGVEVRGRVVATKVGNVSQPDRMVCFASSAFRQPGFYKDESDARTAGAAWVVPHRLGDSLVWRPSVGEAIDVRQSAAFGDGAFRAAAELFGTPVAALLGRPASTLAVAAPAAGALIEVLLPQAVPLRRNGQSCVTVQVDGSTDFLGIGELQDQRRWMNPALSGGASFNTFQHSENDVAN